MEQEIKFLFAGVMNNGMSDYPGEFFIEGKKTWIKKVIYNNNVTIVLFSDGTKTIARCHEDDNFNKETGLLICLFKKFFGSEETRQLLTTWVQDDLSTIDLKTIRKLGK